MTDCALGFIFNSSLERVLLVHKNSPTWQKGLINGVGGKLESEEQPIDCMVRECEEETTLHIPKDNWKEFATIKDSNNTGGATITLFTVIYTGNETDAAQNDHESIEWFNSQSLPPNVIKNLHFLVPLAREVLQGHDVKSVRIDY